MTRTLAVSNRWWLSVLGLFAVAACLGALSSFLSGFPERSWWYAATLGAALACFALPQLANPRLRRALAWGTLGFALLVALLAVIQGSGVLRVTEMDPQGRVVLFWDSPNLLAANLAVASIAALVLLPSASKLVSASLLLCALGMIYTGSRIGLFGYVAGLLVYAFSSRLPGRRQLFLWGTIGLLALVFTFSLPEAEGKNLLRFSNDFAHPVWAKDTGSFQQELSELAGPFGEGQARRVRAQADDSGQARNLVVYQVVERARAGVPYRASVYLRADEPHTVEISSGLQRTSCQVTRDWQRCSTPVAYSHARRPVMFQLRVAEGEDALDVYVWGAQLETGEALSPPDVTDEGPFAFYLPLRINPRIWFDNTADAPRPAIMQAAWEMFLTRPVAGSGLDTFAAVYAQEGYTERLGEASHAHNLLLHLLAESGLLGLLSWLLPFAGILALIWARHWRSALPLLVVIALLNTTDVTYYALAVYYLYWLTLGIEVASEPQRKPSSAALC